MGEKVAIYARVSTQDQNLDNQLRELKEYCEKRGFEIVEIYQDKISGIKTSRPELDKLMDGAGKRKFDIVLVWSFDRLGRSTSHLLSVLENFTRLGIDLISYKQNIDTTTPSGKMMFTIIGSFAEFEREMIRERVLAGQARARAEGKRFGRPKRVGYTEAKKINQLREQGLSYRKIASQTGLDVAVVYRHVNNIHRKAQKGA